MRRNPAKMGNSRKLIWWGTQGYKLRQGMQKKMVRTCGQLLQRKKRFRLKGDSNGIGSNLRPDNPSDQNSSPSLFGVLHQILGNYVNMFCSRLSDALLVIPEVVIELPWSCMSVSEFFNAQPVWEMKRGKAHCRIPGRWHVCKQSSCRLSMLKENSRTHGIRLQTKAPRSQSKAWPQMKKREVEMRGRTTELYCGLWITWALRHWILHGCINICWLPNQALTMRVGW